MRDAAKESPGFAYTRVTVRVSQLKSARPRGLVDKFSGFEIYHSFEFLP